MNDKKNIIASLSTLSEVNLELGCGDSKKYSNYIGVDILDYNGVDIVGDIYEVLNAFPECTVDHIYASHFFEHVPNVTRLLNDIARTMKRGGKLTIVVPHFSNPYYYSDLTHKSFFGLYSMSYMTRDVIHKRRVPDYQSSFKFDLQETRLIFKSPRPFYGRYAFKKSIENIVNISTYTKEFYEEMLCYLIPCYEVRYELVRI